MKKTLQRNMYHVKFGNMTLFIDYEMFTLEKEIILTNPRVDIPSIELVQVDAREHPLWKSTIFDEQMREEIKADLMKRETFAMFCTINYKDLER